MDPTMLEVNRTIDDLDKQLQADHDVFFDELTNQIQFESDDHRKAEKDFGLQKEHTYFNRFVTGVRNMAELNPYKMVTLLIDVDDNIGIVKSDDDGDIRVLVRPAFLLAMQVLQEELPGRLQLGLLTTKPQKSLENDSVNQSYLRGVDPNIINSDYFISSREAELNNGWLDELSTHEVDWNNPEDAVLVAVNGVIDRKQAQKTGVSEKGLPVWYDPKLVILNQLVQVAAEESINTGELAKKSQTPLLASVAKILNDPTEQKRVYVYMDDLPCADVIKPDNRLLGIRMADIQQDIQVRATNPASGMSPVPVQIKPITPQPA